MTRLKYYTTSAVTRLRDSVEARLDWYYDPRAIVANPLVTSPETVRQSRIDLPKLDGGLILPDGAPGAADQESALKLYDSLRTLTPQQASTSDYGFTFATRSAQNMLRNVGCCRGQKTTSTPPRRCARTSSHGTTADSFGTTAYRDCGGWDSSLTRSSRAIHTLSWGGYCTAKTFGRH